jgi:adenylate cyclase
LAHYRGKEWDQAEAALAECRSWAPQYLQGFYDLYEERIAHYRIDPPPADWDGVYEAKTKAG